MNEYQFEQKRVVQEHCQGLHGDTILVVTRYGMVFETLPDPFASTIFEMTERHVFVDALKQTHCQAYIQQARTHFVEEELKRWRRVPGRSWIYIKPG
jgi:hypothetical protein